MDDTIPDDPTAAYAEWIATRPDNLRAWLTENMPTLDSYVPCWRLNDTDGHYVIYAFDTEIDQETEEHVPGGDVTVKVDHVAGPGSRLLADLIPIRVFGVPVEKLVKCGCGNFEGYAPLPEDGTDG